MTPSLTHGLRHFKCAVLFVSVPYFTNYSVLNCVGPVWPDLVQTL